MTSGHLTAGADRPPVSRNGAGLDRDQGRPRGVPVRSVRVAVLAAVFSLGAFVLLFKLTTPTWFIDEAIYATAGHKYVVEGDFSFNLEHPPFFKQVIGVTQAFAGQTLAAVRIPTVVAAMATGVILFLFGRRIRGWWAGCLAAGLWFLLPHTGWPWLEDVARVKIERFGMADVFVSLFMVSALWAGWLWGTTGRTRWALLAGTAAGLAAASKAPGILVAPGIVAGGLMMLRGSRRSWAQSGLFIGALVVTGLAPYAQFAREAPEAIRYLFDFQLAHSSGGHSVLVAGETYAHPPWWSHLWWQWRMVGTAGIVSLAGGVAAAILLSERRVVVFLLAGVFVPLGFLAFGLGFQLPHHALIWQAPLAMVVALGITELASRAGGSRIAALLLLAPLLVVGGSTVREVAAIERSGYAAAADFIRDERAHGGPVIVFGWAHIFTRYLPEAMLADGDALASARVVVTDDVFDWVFVDSDLRRWLEEHRGEFVVRGFDGVSVFLRPG